MNFVRSKYEQGINQMGDMKRGSTRYVYFIQGESTKLIKIGKANDPIERLKGLQTGSPDKLVLLGVIPCTSVQVQEVALHEDFQAFKVHGEWFSPSPELLEYISKATTPYKRVE